MSDDFNQPETFEPTEGILKASTVPMVILGIPLFLVTWLLCSVVLNGLKLPAPGPLGAVVALVVTGLLVWVRFGQLRRNISQISLTVDPNGLTYTGDGARRFLAWGDIREVRRVVPLRGIDAKKAARGVGYDSAAAQGGQLATNAAGELGAQLTAGTGVVGPGRLEVVGGAMAPEAHSQNAGRNGADPQTGEPYVDVPLTQFATRWHEHRIGAWLAHYRPDLVEQAREVVESHPAAGKGD